ncbi:MAG TPA: PDZ domain-containing protein [Planctomycetota bacterium]|nr:PDZ domain-containing protein [Planctomycetota bacterium]
MTVFKKCLLLPSFLLASACFGQAIGPDPAPPAPAEPPQPRASVPKLPNAEELAARAQKAKLAEQYIAELGSDEYTQRAEARRKLMELGRPAIEPLEAAARSEDSETRLRAMEILIALRGRGFLGIGLMEENADVPPGGGEDAENVVDTGESTVRANQIIDYRQGFKDRYGVKRPFPAEAAGMEMSDRVVEINGRPIRGIKDLMNEVILTGPGRVASIVVERGGEKKRIHALLTRNPMTAFTDENGFQRNLGSDKPPVDLEEEIDFTEDDKRASLKAKDPPGAEDFFIIDE